MKTYFIEIVSNPHPTHIPGSIFLGGIVAAKSLNQAKDIVLHHYTDRRIEGGQFQIQCAWEVLIPTREIIEKHWRKYLRSYSIISDKDSDGNVYRVHTFEPMKTKKEVLDDWDRANISWDDVFYDPSRRGYSVTVQGYMQMPCEIAFFKGTTAEIYKKAKQFVKDNTFTGKMFTK